MRAVPARAPPAWLPLAAAGALLALGLPALAADGGTQVQPVTGPGLGVGAVHVAAGSCQGGGPVWIFAGGGTFFATWGSGAFGTAVFGGSGSASSSGGTCLFHGTGALAAAG